MKETPDIHIPDEALKEILDELGIVITGETSTDFLGFCPFHSNQDTAAFNISKETNHYWKCWNPSCGEKGNIYTLLQKINGDTPLHSYRFLRKYRAQRRPKKEQKREYESLDKGKLGEYSSALLDLGYMLNQRGFDEETLRYFKVGRLANYIVVPVFDEYDRLVGFTKRDITPGTKRKYMDQDLPKKFILFNLNNAKTFGSVVVVEGPMDAMKVHQAGFSNVVGVMSGNLSKFQELLLKKYFDSVIIFTDNDEAGRRLGEDIADRCKTLKIYWAQYPNDYKDPGELSLKEIREAIEDKKPNLSIKIKKVLGG